MSHDHSAPALRLALRRDYVEFKSPTHGNPEWDPFAPGKSPAQKAQEKAERDAALAKFIGPKGRTAPTNAEKAQERWQAELRARNF